MADLTPVQQRRVEGILAHIGEYMALRFAHAARVNPKINLFVDDLQSQLLVNLRVLLMKARGWGAEKVMIADILCGDNLTRRFEVLNTTGQYSLLHDVVTALDEMKESGKQSADAVRINSMKTLYGAIDAQVGNLIELAQTWIWWDLPDAVNLHAHHSQVQRIRRLMDLEITPQVQDYYRTALGLPPEENATRDQMIGHEVRRLKRIVLEFDLRRKDDLAHMEVLKREVIDNAGVNQMIRDVAREVEALEVLEKSDKLEDRITQYYAKRLGSDPAHVTREHALRFQRQHVDELKTKLQSALASGQVLGPPRNFKVMQLEEMKTELTALYSTIPPAARDYSETDSHAETARAPSAG